MFLLFNMLIIGVLDILYWLLITLSHINLHIFYMNLDWQLIMPVRSSVISLSSIKPYKSNQFNYEHASYLRKFSDLGWLLSVVLIDWNT